MRTAIPIVERQTRLSSKHYRAHERGCKVPAAICCCRSFFVLLARQPLGCSFSSHNFAEVRYSKVSKRVRGELLHQRIYFELCIYMTHRCVCVLCVCSAGTGRGFSRDKKQAFTATTSVQHLQDTRLSLQDPIANCKKISPPPHVFYWASLPVGYAYLEMLTLDTGLLKHHLRCVFHTFFSCLTVH